MIYSLAYWLIRFLLAVGFRWKVVGAEHVPSYGGAIVVCNHTSYLDPPALGAALPRRIRFMAKNELFRYPGLGHLISGLGAFSVKRGAGDRAAIRRAMEIVEGGELLGMFPEGTRQKTGRLGPAQPGAAMLALKANAPVLPAAVKKKGGWRALEVRIGPSFHLDPGNLDPDHNNGGSTKKEQLNHAGERIMQEISNLLEKD